jgi:hypothetical protein
MSDFDEHPAHRPAGGGTIKKKKKKKKSCLSSPWFLAFWNQGSQVSQALPGQQSKF